MEQEFSVRRTPAQGSRTLSGWRDLLCSRIARLDMVAMSRDGRCTGSLNEVAVGPMRVDRVTVRADPYVVKRMQPRRMEMAAPVTAAVQIHGYCVVCQEGREAVIHPGDLVLFDATRPYRVCYPGGNHTHVALRMPREMLERSLLTLDDVTAVTVSGRSGLGAVVAPLLASLHAALPTLDAATARRLIGHATDLVADVFSHDDRRHGAERAARLLRAQRFIRASLADDDLGPVAVAHAVNVSVGHLHRLFRGTGMTVRESILQARLERCAVELGETAHRDRTVAEIAYRNGFKDAAHFTRAFARRYGTTPARWRRNGARCDPPATG